MGRSAVIDLSVKRMDRLSIWQTASGARWYIDARQDHVSGQLLEGYASLAQRVIPIQMRQLKQGSGTDHSARQTHSAHVSSFWVIIRGQHLGPGSIYAEVTSTALHGLFQSASPELKADNIKVLYRARSPVCSHMITYSKFVGAAGQHGKLDRRGAADWEESLLPPWDNFRDNIQGDKVNFQPGLYRTVK